MNSEEDLAMMMPGPFLLTSIHPSLPLQMFFIVTNNIHLHLYIFLYIFRSNTCRYIQIHIRWGYFHKSEI